MTPSDVVFAIVPFGVTWSTMVLAAYPMISICKVSDIPGSKAIDKKIKSITIEVKGVMKRVFMVGKNCMPYCQNGGQYYIRLQYSLISALLTFVFIIVIGKTFVIAGYSVHID